MAPVITEDATEPAILNGRDVMVERPREILAKKVVYRGRTFQPIVGSCLEIARGVVSVWRDELTPKVAEPLHPKGTHRAVYARDGLTVVIKERDPTTLRFEKIDNPLGPAKAGPDGASFWLGGVEMPEAEWRRHPQVVAALGAAHANPLNETDEKPSSERS